MMKKIVFILLLFLTAESYAQMFVKTDSIDANNNRYTLFTSKKQSVTYIFKEIRSDISLGSEIWKVANGRKTKLDNLDMAAYTKDHTLRMNYNSIIPYISMIQSGNRVIVTFECDFLVLSPDRMSERIEKSKNLYGLMTDTGIEIKYY